MDVYWNGTLSDDYIEYYDYPYIRPSVTLKNTTTISKGDETRLNPYEISQD